jgi:SAM-dependent methyltransferase
MTTVRESDSHVDDVYGNRYFFGGGAGYPNYLDERDLLIQHGNRYGRILANYAGGKGKLLDVGAAAGFILKGLCDYGWKGEGLEPNHKMASYAREILGQNVKTVTFESFQTKTKYDVICLVQVIAHLIDPRTAVEMASSLLDANGYILVETWNYRSLTARVFGRNWHEYSPPSVLHWFSVKSLNQLMELCNFKLIATGRPQKKISSKHAKSLILYKLKDFPFTHVMRTALKLVPDDMAFSYPAEDLFWSLYKRKQSY